MLTRRYATIKLRDLVSTLILLLQAPVIAAVIALVFAGELDTAAGRNAYGAFALFLMAVSAVWFGCSNAAREIVSEQAIYRRERMVNLKIPSYVMSKFVVLGALCAIQCALLLAIVGAATGSACSCESFASRTSARAPARCASVRNRGGSGDSVVE